jgi:hypothetical protein
MPEQPRVEVEVRQYAALLRQAIRAAGFSVSEVERRLGAGPQALRRVLGGSTDLKFKHVVAVLRIIGMSQEEFFLIAALTARHRHGPPAGRELLATFERIGYRGELKPFPDDPELPKSEKELTVQINDAVQRVLERREVEVKRPPSEPPPLLQAGEEDSGDGAAGDEEPE